MPTTRRTRVLPAPVDAVWAVVGDPYELPRWWPKVERVERVSAGRFTEVLRTQRGRPVRADFRVSEHAPPNTIAWAQELAGTPFERVLASASVHVALAPEGDGTAVELRLEQQLRGMSRFGGVLVRRASRKVLDEALDALAAAVAPA